MTPTREGDVAEKRLPSLGARRRAVGLPVKKIVASTGLSRPQVFRALKGAQCSIRTLAAVEAEILRAEADFMRQFVRLRQMEQAQEVPSATGFKI